ncbi:cytidylyltransferase domain-containing protein [Chimaeribacter californicus]|nr:hypothetical protein [Chimaeribacter californicus]
MSQSRPARFVVIIPACRPQVHGEFDPLAFACGKPVLFYTIQQAQESGASGVLVATDDADIAHQAQQDGAQALLTKGWSNDMERVADAAAQLLQKGLVDEATVIVSLPANEPLVFGKTIRELVGEFSGSCADVATIGVQGMNLMQGYDPRVVKVITDKHNRAMYFSRASAPVMPGRMAIPTAINHKYRLRQVQVYAFRLSVLTAYAQWGVCPPEYFEDLEQIRLLWNGGSIQVVQLSHMGNLSIHDIKDIERLTKRLSLVIG